jgi:hypothetical protein
MKTKLLQKTLLVAMMALGSSVVYAQSTNTEIDLGDIKQEQKQGGGTQTMDIGNSTDGGKTKVTGGGNITQTQDAGGKSVQSLRIGNAEGAGSESDVTISGTVTQTQKGEHGEGKGQSLSIGDASGGGKSKVSINNLEQTQDGTDNLQQMSIGDAKGAGTSTDVTITGLVKQEQLGGRGNTQIAEIGNATKGSTKVKLNNFTQTQGAGTSGATQRARIGNSD